MDANGSDSTKRFSDRVSDYTRYRPGYPVESIDWIYDNVPLSSNSTIADIGSGTGIFTEALVSKACSVVAVEPNEAMRLESDRRLSTYPNYTSIDGTAEHTKLDSNSIDLVTAAQAFHWFDLEKTKIEFERILGVNGKVLLIWNRRNPDASEFLAQYEALLKSSIAEYNRVNHANATDSAIAVFLGDGMTTAEFASYQEFDLDGLKGRLQSSSYCPVEGTSEHSELMNALTSLYNEHASDSGVKFEYSTQLYLS